MLDKIEEDLESPLTMEEQQTSDSIDASCRVEMPWDGRLQKQLERWNKIVHNRSVKHERRSTTCKFRHRLLGIPSAIIPLCLGIFNSFIPSDSLTTPILLATSSCLSAINTSIDYGGLVERHSHASIKYEKLESRIDYILAQPKRNRAAADVIMTEVRYTMNEIQTSAPDL